MRKTCPTGWKRLKLGGIALSMLGAAACAVDPATSSGFDEYMLVVTPPSGGTITTPDGSVHCPGQCVLTRPLGTQIQLMATPEAAALFDSWTQGCADQTSPTCAITFDRNWTVAARFSTCADQLRNGTETGIDCGGSLCAPCAAGGACMGDSDCAAGLACASGTCKAVCNASSVTILGNRSPTITPATVPAGDSATVRCRYPTYQFLLDTTVVQDLTTNNAAKADQTISCNDDGSWSTASGSKFNTVNCVGFAPCNGCALPGTDAGAPRLP